MKELKNIYLLGGIATVVVLIGVFIDVAFGSASGGNLTALPQSAVARFEQFRECPLLGLYNLDLLNIINQMIMMPAFFALYVAHRKSNKDFGLLALILFLFGSVLLVANNVALPMYELSLKYFATLIEAQRSLYAAAGESLLVQGSHDSLAVFFGFLLPNIAILMMAVVMLKGGTFSKFNAWCGILGSIFMVLYVLLVHFVPVVERMATVFAMPGGLMLMLWMILYAIRLFKLSK